MEKEIIDLVDADDNIIGVTDVDTAHRLKQFHRVVAAFIFDIDGDLYLQKENGRYDNSVGGHVGVSESYKHAAHREMQEELGLDIPLKEISIFLPAKTRLNHRWALYEGVAPIRWEFKKTEEVKIIEKLHMDDIIFLMNSKRENFTYGFINTMKEYIRVKKLSYICESNLAK